MRMVQCISRCGVVSVTVEIDVGTGVHMWHDTSRVDLSDVEYHCVSSLRACR